MKRGKQEIELAVGLGVLLSLGVLCLGGAVYQNDSGAPARAVRIEFSEPAEITFTNPNFTERTTQGPATVVVLSGGEVPAWGWFSFSWRPTSAHVIRVEWLPVPPGAQQGQSVFPSIDWNSLPYFLEYLSYEGVTFWCHGPKNMNNARYWGRPGYDVRGMKLFLDQNGIAIRLVMGSRAFPEYSYNIRFSKGTETFHVNVYPRHHRIGFAYSDGQTWHDLGSAPSTRLLIGERSLTVLLYAADLPEPFAPTDLASWMIQLHLQYSDEWFAFPGSLSYEGYRAALNFQRTDCQVFKGNRELSIPNPENTDEVVQSIYELTRTSRPRTGAGPFTIPVYLSVPYLTPITDVFEVALDGQPPVAMSRVDSVNLVGIAEVQDLPRIFDVEVRRNGEVIHRIPDYPLRNAYEAITAGIASLEGVESCAPMPREFVRAAALTDIWGSYLYGAADEWRRVHLRNYFASTCDRLVEDGFTDVYVTSFLSYYQIQPMPVLDRMSERDSPGACVIREPDLRKLVETAHERGLRFHLMYNAYAPGEVGMGYLWQARKSEAWITSILDQYKQIIVEEAEMAERCGVDAIVLYWQHGAVTYEGQEAIWTSRWREIIHEVRKVFSGQIEFNLATGADIRNVVEGRIPLDIYSGVDSFLYSQWNPHLTSYRDSVEEIYRYFKTWLAELTQFKTLVQRPIILEVSFQSYDGYLVHGWFDAAIGKVGPNGPDFFEQARAYEALLQALRRTTVIDGIISYKYHWDDPFGPDLGVPALARMDLEGSIRNKPAEAVVKKWF